MSLSPRIRKPKNDRQISLFVSFSCSSLGASDFSVGYTSATPAAATLAALSEIGSEVKMDLQFMHFHLKRERSRKERGLKREQVRGEGREEKTNGREREERITSSSAKRHGLWHHKRNLDIQ